MQNLGNVYIRVSPFVIGAELISRTEWTSSLTLHIRGAENSVVFEKSHTLKMICIRDKIKNDISFIINKKTLIHLPAGVLMKS